MSEDFGRVRIRTSDAESARAQRCSRERVRNWTLAAILSIVAAATWLRVVTRLPLEIHSPDFSIAYTQSLMLRQGHDPYVLDMTSFAEPLGFNVHPIRHAVDAPSMIALFELITLFRPATGYWIWFAVNIGLLLAAMAMLLDRVEYGPRTPEFWIAAALILLYPPVWCNFLWAQTQVLALFLLVSAAMMIKRGSDSSAAALVAIAGCLRIYPFAAMGFFLVKRNWNALAIAAAIAGAITGLTIAIVGIHPYFTYFRGLSYTLAVTEGNASLAAFAARMVAWPPLRGVLTAAADLGILCLAIWPTFRSDRSRSFILWIVTAVALSPIVWIHYFVLLLIPFSEILFGVWGADSRAGAIAAAANYLAIMLVVANEAHAAGMSSRSTIDLHVIRDGLFAALVLGYVATWQLANRDRRRGSETEARKYDEALPA